MLNGYVSLASDLRAEFTSRHASAIVHLHPNKKCYRAAKDAAIPIRIGYPLNAYSNDELTHVIEDRRAHGLQHEGAYNFDLLKVLGVERPTKLEPSVHLTEVSKRSLQGKLSWDLESTRFTVLAASAHSPHRRWPKERFREAADRLQAEYNLLPVFVGSSSDEPNAWQHCSLVGKTDLAELGWLLRYAHLLITNDTGPAHLAAAADCSSLVIFGRTTLPYGPTRWRPLSEKAAILTKPIRKRFLEGNSSYWKRSFAAISVDDVLTAARTILGKSC